MSINEYWTYSDAEEIVQKMLDEASRKVAKAEQSRDYNAEVCWRQEWETLFEVMAQLKAGPAR